MLREHQYFVYILSSRSRTLYIGVTNSLLHRLHQHRAGKADSFTTRYKIHRLVYFERFQSIANAIARGKLLKHYTREEKDSPHRIHQSHLGESSRSVPAAFSARPIAPQNLPSFRIRKTYRCGLCCCLFMSVILPRSGTTCCCLCLPSRYAEAHNRKLNSVVQEALQEFLTNAS
jgi:putative endonuclease